MKTSLLRIAILTMTALVLLQLVGCKTPKKETPIKTAKTPTNTNEKDKQSEKLVSPLRTNTGPGESLPMISEKPLFNLKLDLKKCAYTVYVNGGIVASDMMGEPIEAELPINHWLRTGANEIEVYMMKWPEDPDLCDIKLDLVYRDASAQSAGGSGRIVSTLAHSAKAAAAGTPVLGSSEAGLLDSKKEFKPSEQGDVLVGPAYIRQLTGKYEHIQILCRSFNLHLPFPEWDFFRGEYVRPMWEWESDEASEPAYQEILAAYQKVWKILSARDINGFLVACGERSRETDIAYYKKPGETRDRLRRALEIAMKDTDLELATLDVKPGNTWVYDVGSKGTLIALTQGTRSDSIFRFQTKKGSPFSYIFPVVFRKEGSQYIVTR